MDKHFEIGESDLLRRENLLKRVSDGTETLVDIENGVFVNLGIPANEYGAIVVPENPHIFIVDELYVIDGAHSQGLVLKNTAVLMAHGVRDQNDRWNFVGGKSVVETVEVYNKYAKREQLPTVEFLVACNEDFVTSGTGIQIHEFGQNSAIAYAVGEVMNVSGMVEDNGLTRVYVNTQDKIINLDQLSTSKEILMI